jgi:hypothetical protein
LIRGFEIKRLLRPFIELRVIFAVKTFAAILIKEKVSAGFQVSFLICVFLLKFNARRWAWL